MSERYGCPEVRGHIRCVLEEDHRGGCDFDASRAALPTRDEGGLSLKERDLLTREATLFFELMRFRMGLRDERKRDFAPLLAERLIKLSGGRLAKCDYCRGQGETVRVHERQGEKVPHSTQCADCGGLGVLGVISKQ